MANSSASKRKPTPASVDKFRVGQHVVLVLSKSTGWERANGEMGVVVGPKRKGKFWCDYLDRGGPKPRELMSGDRYAVRWSGGISNFEEEHLRAIYDQERLSTWEKFSKVTGVRIGAPKFMAEASHG